MIKYFMAFLAALTLSFILTPYAKKIAYRIGAIDVPKDNRRVHQKPIPRLGGLAIFIAFITTTLLVVPMDRSLLCTIIGATMIVFIGILDDTKPISAKYKLLVQIGAALMVVYGGVRIEFITNVFNRTTGMTWLGIFSIPVTVFWIVGITNTINLIDGLDGLAAGVASIASICLAFVAYLNGQAEVAILLSILAGASIGFLPYNFNPAQIFMGDTGSLLIGFLLATFSAEGVFKSAATIAIAVPIVALGIPIFDTVFAIFRRIINKRPIMEADKGHLHHRLLEQGLSQKQTVLILYCISTLLGGSAIIISDISRISAYYVLAFVSGIVLIGAFRIGLMKKPRERKANM
jgi:UDP-GlcNAc:undecaprenyl-phosphate/decaprenyl-phosphate GlcNAc-1-phosphate transferase